MKFRVKAPAGALPLRVEVPELCDLRTLSERVSAVLNVPSGAVRLSLNNRDEVAGPSNVLLSSAGLRSGDLLYVLGDHPAAATTSSASAAPPGSTRSPVGLAAAPPAVPDSPESRGPVLTSPWEVRGRQGASAAPLRRAAKEISAADLQRRRRELCAAAAATRQGGQDTDVTTAPVLQDAAPEPSSRAAAGSEVVMEASAMAQQESGGAAVTGAEGVFSTASSDKEGPMVGIQETGEPMEGVAGPVGGDGPPGLAAAHAEGDGRFAAPGAALPPPPAPLVPDVVQRVAAAEGCNVRAASDWVVIAAHAAMLEAGLQLAPPPGGDTWRLPEGWNRGTRPVSLSYVLAAQSEGEGAAVGPGAAISCTLKAHVLGPYLLLYGALRPAVGGAAPSTVYRLSLPVAAYVNEDEGAGGDASSASNATSVYREVHRLWRVVKDGLAIPLLTTMCQLAGVPPPPSLLVVPAELKAAILSRLPAAALGRLACTCREMRFQAADDDTWRALYVADFGAPPPALVPGTRPRGGWKAFYVLRLEGLQLQQRMARAAEAEHRRLFFASPPVIPRRPFYQPPGMIGGDYDRFPAIGGGLPGQRGPPMWGRGPRGPRILDLQGDDADSLSGEVPPPLHSPPGPRALREVGDLPGGPMAGDRPRGQTGLGLPRVTFACFHGPGGIM